MATKIQITIDRKGDLKFDLTLDQQLKTITISRLDAKTLTPIPIATSEGDAVEILRRLKLSSKDTAPLLFSQVISSQASIEPLVIKLPDNNETVGLTWEFENITLGHVTVNSDGITLQQKELEQLIPTELRLAVNGTAQKHVNIGEISKDMMPKTDLHTHFAGTLSADTLIGGIKKKLSKGQPVNYPIKFLLEIAGINWKDLAIYFSSPEEFLSFKKSFRENPNATFDITKMFQDKHKISVENDQKNTSNIDKLKTILQIPANKTIVFNDMEKYYEYRDVLVKDRSLLAYFLEEIGNDYQKQGLKYVEISFSKVTDPACLKIIEEIVPDIEQKTGVTMRFLGIIARTAQKEHRESQIAMYEQFAAKSPYVVGMDLLAAEINSTYDVFPELIGLCEWAKVNYPGMVVRIHAGETSYHPENIAGVVDLAQRYPNINFRVGHGIYGVHDDLIRAMKKCTNIIPEINMASNATLNMKSDLANHTLFKYIEEGIPVVLGSDGHGLYQSHPADLIKLLHYAEGVDVKSFSQNLNAIEEKHIKFVHNVFPERAFLFLKEFLEAAKATGEFEELTNASSEKETKLIHHILSTPLQSHSLLDASGNPTKFSSDLVELYQKTKKQPIFNNTWEMMYKNFFEFKSRLDTETKAREAQRQVVLEEKTQALTCFCKTNNINLFKDDLNNEAPSLKTPIMINGIILVDDSIKRDEIISETAAMILTMLETMDPNEFYFCTTGVDYGVQKMVHKLVHDYNRQFPDRSFDLVGYVPTDVKASDLFPNLTHVISVEDVSSVYNMYEYIDKRVRDYNGLKLVTIGGKMWNKDVIQVAFNALKEERTEQSPFDTQLYLVSEAGGAAAEKAKDFGLQSQSSIADITKRLIAQDDKDIGSIFQTHLTSFKKAENDNLRATIHGTETPSTPLEYATKLKLFINSVYPNKKIKVSDLEAYFVSRIYGKAINSDFEQTMQSDEELQKVIEKFYMDSQLPDQKPVKEQGPEMVAASKDEQKEPDDKRQMTHEEKTQHFKEALRQTTDPKPSNDGTNIKMG